MKCGLLGRKLGHSYSPAIHARLGEYQYVLYEKEPAELEAFLRNGDWDGLNVTMPYKKAVIPYLDGLTDTAATVGAVNTIYRQNGKRIGHNTDFYGFQQMLLCSRLHPQGKKCLVLGSGGASDVAVRVLKDAGGNVVVISRSGENNYSNLDRHKDAAIMINATPVGMYPQTGVAPLDLKQFPQLEGVLDVIYNPARTKLLMDAEQRGLVTMNGLWMLVMQAKESAERFMNHPIEAEQAKAIYNSLRRQMENIILIGMPGCGKSTIGRLVAEKLGRTFVDTDAEIEKKAQKSIPRIFAEDGEAAFRSLETEVLAQFGRQSGLVIATGGGCVTKADNYPLLHQNGTIFWLQRDLKKLPTEGRPLSTDLVGMYDVRKPLYASFADHTVDNNTTLQETTAQILAYWEEKT
jgi:shikimate dehydrogenase